MNHFVKAIIIIIDLKTINFFVIALNFRPYYYQYYLYFKFEVIFIIKNKISYFIIVAIRMKAVLAIIIINFTIIALFMVLINWVEAIIVFIKQIMSVEFNSILVKIKLAAAVIIVIIIIKKKLLKVVTKIIVVIITTTVEAIIIINHKIVVVINLAN